MDILIKNNVIKKNKLIVDIGSFAAKVLEVHYAAKKVTVLSARTIPGREYTEDKEISFSELAKIVASETSGQGKRDVSVSLPSELCENKIITIKNKKESELSKIIKKDYMSFGRANPITHVVDYAFLGKREEEGDTVFYFLLSALQKSVAAELVSAFAKYKLKVKTVVSSIYNQICLSELFFDEYEHLSRLFVDFGTASTRITAFSDGLAVYTRTNELGFESYVNRVFETDPAASKPEIIKTLMEVGTHTDLSDGVIGDYFMTLDKEVYENCVNEISGYIINDIMRVIDLCASNDFSVSKIYCTGYTIDGLLTRLSEKTGTQTEQIIFNSLDEKEGKGFELLIDDIYFDGAYSNALGMSIYPML